MKENLVHPLKIILLFCKLKENHRRDELGNPEILRNGINEGFAGTLPEKLSYIGLMGLLAVNSILLVSARKQQAQ